MLRDFSHPVLSRADALEWERGLLGGDEQAEWQAMSAAGGALGAAVLQDFREFTGRRTPERVLVLAGKGNNGGDALIAAHWLLRRHPGTRVSILPVFGERRSGALCRRAHRELAESAPDRVRTLSARGFSSAVEAGEAFDVCLDGIFGVQFRPPLGEPAAGVISRVNAMRIGLRAAVDLPTGIAETAAETRFRADCTYATGILKEPVLRGEHAADVGRIRYLDLKFFGREPERPNAGRVVLAAVLDPLRVPRPARSDKRAFGHVFVLGGSRSYPGAVMLTVLGALRSGAGLVSAFVPESLAPAFAARAPEAMWVGCPETPGGGVALEAVSELRARLSRASSLVIGPGLGREQETRALVAEALARSPVPVILDADALQPSLVAADDGRGAKRPVLATPHAGEFARISGTDGTEDGALAEFCRRSRWTLALKGPVTRICDGGPVFSSLFGGPVLARGGSGDILAGMAGTLAAQYPQDPLYALGAAVAWHGLAAEAWARRCGQRAAATSDLLDWLGIALRDPQ